MKQKDKKKEKKERKNGSTLTYLLFAATFIGIGVCFIAFTSASINLMCYFIGGVTILAAAFNAVLALADKKRGGAFYLKLILCALAVVCGVVTIVNREGALEYIVGAVAFLLVIESAYKLQLAVRGKSFKAPLWWGMVFLVVACFALEVYLIKFYNTDMPGLMVGLLGGLLILDGASNLIAPVYLALVSRREKEATKERENNTTKNEERK